eukprot:5380719-Amphidinium_carterae.1
MSNNPYIAEAVRQQGTTAAWRAVVNHIATEERYHGMYDSTLPVLPFAQSPSIATLSQMSRGQLGS